MKYIKDQIPEKFKNKQNYYQENITRDFGKHLRELRKEKNWTQKQTADMLLVAESTYANWEQGRTEPDLYHLVFIAAVFDIDMNTLFEFIYF